MIEDEIEFYVKAGKAVKYAKTKLEDIVKTNVRLLDICERIEQIIENLGCKPAFPCNICINEVAAHYTPTLKSTKRIAEGSLVKVDIGAHYNGFIADSAITINVDSEYEELVTAVEEALENAIKILEPNMRISKISGTIEKTIKYYGFKPIINLAGHQLEQYRIHTGKIIPNTRLIRDLFNKLEPGYAYAIEPFATTRDGIGEVIGKRGGHIYRLNQETPPKEASAKKLFLEIKREFKTLPFAKRWFKSKAGNLKFEKAFEYLKDKKYIKEYPALIEANGEPVAQAEHTIIVTRKEVIVIT